MANPEHLEWLCEGVVSWNRRRRETPFVPDLARTDLTEVLRPDLGPIAGRISLKAVDLSEANLSESTLTDVDLTGADLSCVVARNAKFERCVAEEGGNFFKAQLVGAKFIGVAFSIVNFGEAALDHGCICEDSCFADCDFTEATFVGTTLGPASEFFGCYFRRANFRNALLAGTPRRGLQFDNCHFLESDVTFGELSNCGFSMCDFEKAAFTAVEMKAVGFESSGFVRAQFVSIALRDVTFRGCDLSDALFLESDVTSSFEESVLDGVWFERCSLAGADLSRASTRGAAFSRSDACEARLFERRGWSGGKRSAKLEGSLTDVGDLLRQCEVLREAYGSHARFYFRGEEDIGWDLRPAVARRSASEEGKVLARFEGEMLKELMTRRPQAFRGLGSAVERWVVAQHEGLPTRLLEVTRDPLVGLFFACNGSMSRKADGCFHVFAAPLDLIRRSDQYDVRVVMNFALLPEKERERLLGRDVIEEWPLGGYDEHVMAERSAGYMKAKEYLEELVRRETGEFAEGRVDPKTLFSVLVVEPVRRTERVIRQSSAFLVSGFHGRFEREAILKASPRTIIYGHHTWRIPQATKRQLMRQLAVLNVSREILFPGVESAAGAIVKEFEARVGHGD